jgi:hypothetical protein
MSPDGHGVDRRTFLHSTLGVAGGAAAGLPFPIADRRTPPPFDLLPNAGRL